MRVIVWDCGDCRFGLKLAGRTPRCLLEATPLDRVHLVRRPPTWCPLRKGPVTVELKEALAELADESEGLAAGALKGGE